MRVVVQRVERASVTVDGVTTGKIGAGLLAYVAIERGDTENEIAWMTEKIINLRIFPDTNYRMNLSIKETGGAILSVSQFTLASRIGRGRRPDFTNAGDPATAEALWKRFNELTAREVPVQTGVFGAAMMVDSLNAGPVTFVIDRSAPTNGENRESQ